jgi:hypothetical protein
MISVVLSSPDPSIAAQWTDLLTRASPNVFMDPAALCAAHVSNFAKIHVLLAWDDSELPKRLVGLWAFRVRKIALLWPAHLEALPYEYAFLSNPVIDRAFVDETISAFLRAIVNDHTLPNIISLPSFDAESPSYLAILKTVAALGGQQSIISESARPFATPEHGVKKSGSTRKKLRQDWNRLCALGPVDLANERNPTAAQEAFETFLRLEADSWKGVKGTALLSNAQDAAFVRQLVAGLTEDGNLSVALLRVDGRAIAAQVLMYCGSRVYTWKTAFNADFARFSPGALLVDKVTEALFSEPGMDGIDSCSAEGGFMGQLWPGRRKMVDLLVDVSPRKSLGFALEVGRQRGFLHLRSLVKRLQKNRWMAKSKVARQPSR